MSNQQRDLVADLERCRRVAAYGTTVAYSSSNKEAEELHGDMFGMLLHVLPRAIRAEARVKELERVHPALTQTATALGCSFCGKPREETRFLIAGLKVYICDECLDLCNRIADDMQLKVNAEAREVKRDGDS